MKAHECYHCKKWIEENEEHDCWNKTEEAVTENLTEDLMDAWQRIRETAADFGEQRIYAAGNSIMFSRKHCYFFVRPKKKYLEVCFFLGRKIKHPLIKKTHQTSKVKVGHLLRIVHRDEVESPITQSSEENRIGAFFNFFVSARGIAPFIAPLR